MRYFFRMDSIHTGVLLFWLFQTASQEIRHAAVSSDITFCFKPCTDNSVYKIHHGDNPNIVTIFIRCHSHHQIPDKFEGRIRVDEATGCVTLCNVTKSDGGLYALEHTNGNGRKEPKRQITYVLYDKVWIRALSRNDTDGNISLTVACAGDPDTITWMDGGDLTDRYWLSDDNRTLTIPYDVTGGVTVHVSNLVSAERRHITLVNDGNGKLRYLDPIMHQNNQTLILPRNITHVYVLTRSANNDPEVHQSRNDKTVVIIPVVVTFVILLAVGVVVFLQKRNGAQPPGII